jgi:putative transposase
VRLSDGQRKTLADLGKKLGKQALAEGTTIVKPETILAWHRRPVDPAGITRVPLPPRSPNLNAYAERWVRSVKDEVLSRLILVGEPSLRYAIQQYETHYHHERPHLGKGNVMLMPNVTPCQGRARPIQCRERLGGLLNYYYREAA